MNAVIYARYSPGPRQTDQSIEGQVRDCMAYAKENNITVLNVYADKHSPDLTLPIGQSLTV